MNQLFRIVLAVAMPLTALAQDVITGHVFDQETKEPLVGANIVFAHSLQGAVTNVNGGFTITRSNASDTLVISYIGYERYLISQPAENISIALKPSANTLQQVMVTGNREAALRTEMPIAISKISPQMISETKPVFITELINKVPGVVMLNYNNEQHAMAIRQPMGTAAYFLYLEDGIPIRPMGIFNHNALIEMNVFGISNIEVIKGPASSLYGPEAVGGAINFITHRPTSVPVVRVGIQGDQWGYKRVQYAGGGTIGHRFGLYVSGFEARQRDAWQTYSDFDKSSINVRADYSLSTKTSLTAAFTAHEYYSDMNGNVDSTGFYSRSYSTTSDFTYRKVHSQRSRLSLTHQWNNKNETAITIAYRDNYIQQNPTYSIRWSKGKTDATGEVNRNSFYSKVILLQHRAGFNFLDARLLTGVTIDQSPTNYWAYKTELSATLRPDGKSVEKFQMIRELQNQFLSNYHATLRNYAAFSQFEFSPLQRLKVTLGARYDRLQFDYDNHLDNSTGTKFYQQVTPKIGATFDLSDKGLYANYSEGFSPPGLTSIFRKKSSFTGENAFYYDLEPARFKNLELGGWASLFNDRFYLDMTVYQMRGYRELLSVRQPDNSTDYQSAGKTLHQGIEYGFTYKPSTAWTVRFGGTNAIHRFLKFDLSSRANDVVNANGKEMPQAPRWIANNEITYRPGCIRGLRIAAEWQRIGPWYEDQLNKHRYNARGFLGLRGISYLNARAGYEWKALEMFISVMNITNELYANSATRGNGTNDRAVYTPAAPRTFVVGLQYTLTKKPEL